jgi:ribonucleoside-diphosphate reductase alpha chain
VNVSVPFFNLKERVMKSEPSLAVLNQPAMEPQLVTTDVLLEKYAKGDESSASEIFARVAKGIAKFEAPELRDKYEALFVENMHKGAIGAGRIMSAAGTGIKASLINCFVQPVGDAIQGVDDDGYPGIYEALREAAETMRRGGGVGYDFTRIRPAGSFVKGTASNASGPCSYMDVFDSSCKTVESAGSRRGAQMGVLKINHPDILEFITAKRTPGRWNNFNVSVGIVDGFMPAVEQNSMWQLVHKAQPTDKQIADGAYQRADGMWVYRELPAQEIWDTIMKSTYDFAEPGILFLDRMNYQNNLRYAETIEASNPCAEQPLPAYGCCDLGPIILPKFVRNPFTIEATFDAESFVKSVALQVRFLDDVLMATYWPLPQQRTEAENKRRIGVGFTGLGNMLAMMGVRYNSEEGVAMASRVAKLMRDAAYEASVDLAIEKGRFPLFDAEKYLEEGTFASALPEALKARIREHGIRNSHLLSIAPTGTVSLAFADNASNGIEPPFSLCYQRKKRVGDGHVMYQVLDHALRVFVETVCEEKYRTPLLDALCSYKDEFQVGDLTYKVKDVLPESFVTALEMTAAEHLAVMAAVQPFIDTAISKTVNVPEDYSFEDFKGLYMAAWKAQLKGLATYRPNSTLGSVLSLGATPEKPKAEAKEIDPLKVVFERRPDGDMDAVNSRVHYITDSGSKSIYLSVSFAPVSGVIDGEEVVVERPLEIFIPSSQSDVPQEWIASFARQLSLNARSGFLGKALTDARQVKSDRGRVRFGHYEKPDGTKVPRFHDSEVGAIAYAIQQILVKRGFLDEEGNQVPTRKLLKARAPQVVVASLPVAAESRAEPVQHGKKCSECGAHAVVRRDGCDHCTACQTVGSCG